MTTLADAVTFHLDGRDHIVAAGTTLAALVASLGHEQPAVATSIDGLFVSRADRAARLLQSGDHVLLFKPISGG
jgi:sulfur carrier protein